MNVVEVRRRREGIAARRSTGEKKGKNIVTEEGQNTR